MKKYLITGALLATITLLFNGCSKVKTIDKLDNCGTDKDGHKLYYEEFKGCYYLLPNGNKEAVLPSLCTCKTP